MSRISTLYLLAYNTFQAIGWYNTIRYNSSSHLFLSASHSLISLSQGAFFNEDFVQSSRHRFHHRNLRFRRQFNLFSAMRRVLGSIVPSGVLFPLMQWGGRTHFVLAIVRKLDELQELPSVFITFLAWSMGELFGKLSALDDLSQALPIIKKKNLYADSFSGLPFSYYDFLKVVLVVYPFLWFKLYLHMFKQRRTKLYKRHDKKRA
ncbi:Very-long-chain (3R)-3-hydroxyacyl-CoA dehydratase 2, partial [Mucuna pruriens]